MKPKSLISLLLVALTIGFFLGRWQARHTMDQYTVKLMLPEIERATADFSRTAGLLKSIRAGDTNSAIETLEGDLNMDILMIGAATEATPVSKRDPQWLSRIRWLREYRTQYSPKTNDAFLEEQVEQTLSLVQTNL